jgi:hypothetical protein
MAWDRAKASDALVSVLAPAVGVKVHGLPPETLNPPCVVVHRPVTVDYGIGGLGVDQAALPLVIVGGIESEDEIEALKTTVRTTLLADPTLGAVVFKCWPTQERNWLNRTGAGGIQLLTVELMLEVLA